MNINLFIIMFSQIFTNFTYAYKNVDKDSIKFEDLSSKYKQYHYGYPYSFTPNTPENHIIITEYEYLLQFCQNNILCLWDKILQKDNDYITLSVWKLCKKDIFCFLRKITHDIQKPSKNFENLYNNFKWVICDKNKSLHFNQTICPNPCQNHSICENVDNTYTKQCKIYKNGFYKNDYICDCIPPFKWNILRSQCQKTKTILNTQPILYEKCQNFTILGMKFICNETKKYIFETNKCMINISQSQIILFFLIFTMKMIL